DAALAVLVEARRGHAIGAVDLARDVLASRRTHAVHEPEVRALLGDPHRPLRAVAHVGHAVAQRRRGVGGEEIGRQPAEIHVAVGGDHLVAHRGRPHALPRGALSSSWMLSGSRKMRISIPNASPRSRISLWVTWRLSRTFTASSRTLREATAKLRWSRPALFSSNRSPLPRRFGSGQGPMPRPTAPFDRKAPGFRSMSFLKPRTSV